MSTPGSGRSRTAPFAVAQAASTRPKAGRAATTSPYVTPLVGRTAAKLGVDLAQVTGTGVGGRVTPNDVRAHAGVSTSRSGRGSIGNRAAAARAAISRPSIIRTQTSVFDKTARIDIDAYSTSPLADDLRQGNPEAFRLATARGPVPGMFASGGDLPLFVAGGFDPQLLLVLPWRVRHKAAETESAAKIAELFELCGGGDLAAVYQAELLGTDARGWASYSSRFDAWYRLAYSPPPSAPVRSFRADGTEVK